MLVRYRYPFEIITLFKNKDLSESLGKFIPFPFGNNFSICFDTAYSNFLNSAKIFIYLMEQNKTNRNNIGERKILVGISNIFLSKQQPKVGISVNQFFVNFFKS